MLTDVVIANKTYAKLVLPDNAVMDDIAVNVIKQDIPDFLLPVKMINIDGNTELRYEIGEGTRLSYLPDSMTKREFVILLENMIRPFQTCNDWFLDYHSFCLNSDYIIVSRNYTNVRYIYVPDDTHRQSEEDVLTFFREFILNTNLSDEPAYVMNLYRQLKEKNSSLVSMLDYLVRETGGSQTATYVEAAPQKQEEKKRNFVEAGMNFINNRVKEEVAPKVSKPVQEEVPPVKPVETYQPQEEFGKKDVKGDLINNLFGDVEESGPKKKGKAPKAEKPVKEKSSKGLLGGIFGGSKANNANTNANVGNVYQAQVPMQNSYVNNEPPRAAVQQTVRAAEPVSYYDGDDVTMIGGVEAPVGDGSKLTLQLEEDRGYQFPKYIEIDLKKGYATIGRFDKAGNPQADYNFDASLSFISKRHFRIERVGSQYRIIDVGSSNGTMLNGTDLVANMPYTLNIGDKIIISRKHKVTYRVC
ncbi:MAG: FHA domain-containing protein [Lachnospiraceae bacterium]|nr:FHA domain-containing protein [Lachnospiraceae bacterium]